MTNTTSRSNKQGEQNEQITEKTEQLKKLKTDIDTKKQELDALKAKKDLSEEEVIRITQLETEILRLEQELKNLQIFISPAQAETNTTSIMNKIANEAQTLTDSQNANVEKLTIIQQKNTELMTLSDIESLFALHNDKTLQELEAIDPSVVEKLTSMFMGLGGTNCLAKITRMILRNSLVDPSNIEKSKFDMTILQQNLANYDYSSITKFYTLTQNNPVVKSLLSEQDVFLIQKMFDPTSKLGQSLQKDLLEPNITLFGPTTLLQMATQVNQDATTTGPTEQSSWTKFVIGVESMGIKAREKGKRIGSTVGKYVAENPGKAVLIVGSVAVGGWLISKLFGGKKEEEESADKSSNKKGAKKKKSFWRKVWNFVKRPLGIGAVIYGGKKLFDRIGKWIQTGIPPWDNGKVNIHDTPEKKQQQYEQLDKQKQEVYKKIANSVNNQEKDIFLPEYATGWDGRLQDSYIDENGNEVPLEKENPMLDGATMYAIDETYATLGHFLSEGGITYFSPFGTVNELIAFVKQSAAEKILKPFVSKLPGWIGGDTRAQSIENWIKEDKARVGMLHYFFRQHAKILTYMNDLQNRLLEHFILEKLLTDGYKGKTYTIDQCLAFRADPRESELHDIVQEIKKDENLLTSWHITEKITTVFTSKKVSEAYEKAQELLAKQAPTEDQVLSVRILNTLAQGIPYNGKAYTKKELDKMSQSEKQTLLETIKNDTAWLSEHNISQNTNETMSLDLRSIVADCDDIRYDITYDSETKKDVIVLAKEEIQKGNITEKTAEKLQIVCEELGDMLDDHDGNPGFFGALFDVFRGIANTQGINEEEFLKQSGLEGLSQRYKAVLDAYTTKLTKRPPEAKDVQDFCSFANDIFALQKEVIIGATSMMEVKDKDGVGVQRIVNSFLNTFTKIGKVLFDQETKMGFGTEAGYVVSGIIGGSLVLMLITRNGRKVLLKHGRNVTKYTVGLPLYLAGNGVMLGGKELLARTFIPRLRYTRPTGKIRMMDDLMKGKLPLNERIVKYIPTQWITTPGKTTPGKIMVDFNNPKQTYKQLMKFLTGADDTQAELLVEYRNNPMLRKQMINMTNNAMVSKRGLIQWAKRNFTNQTLLFTPNSSNIDILAEFHKHASSGSAMRHILDNFNGTENDLRKLYSAIQDDSVLKKIKTLSEDQAKKLGKYISRFSDTDLTQSNIDATIRILSDLNDTDINKILSHTVQDVTDIAARIEIGRVKNVGVGLPLEFNDPDIAGRYANFKQKYEDLIKNAITDVNERKKLDQEFAKAMILNGDIVPLSAIRGNSTLETARNLSMKHLDEVYQLIPGGSQDILTYAKKLRNIQHSIIEAVYGKKSIETIKNLTELLEAVRVANKGTTGMLDSAKILAHFAELTRDEIKSVKNTDEFIALLSKNTSEVERILKAIGRNDIFDAMIKNFKNTDELAMFLKFIGKAT